MTGINDTEETEMQDTHENARAVEPRSFTDDFRYAWPVALGHSMRLHMETQDQAAKLNASIQVFQQSLPPIHAIAQMDVNCRAMIDQKAAEIREDMTSRLDVMSASLAKHLNQNRKRLLDEVKRLHNGRLEELQAELLRFSQRDADTARFYAEADCDRLYAQANAVSNQLHEVCNRLDRPLAQRVSDDQVHAAEIQLRRLLQRSTVWERLRWLIWGDLKARSIVLAPNTPAKRTSKAS